MPSVCIFLSEVGGFEGLPRSPQNLGNVSTDGFALGLGSLLLSANLPNQEDEIKTQLPSLLSNSIFCVWSNRAY